MDQPTIEEMRAALAATELPPEEDFARMVAIGLINSEGQLTKLYGGQADPESWAKRPPAVTSARSKHLWPMSPTLRVRNRQFRPTLRASAQTGRGSRHASKGGVQERGFGQGERPMKVEHVDS